MNLRCRRLLEEIRVGSARVYSGEDVCACPLVGQVFEMVSEEVAEVHIRQAGRDRIVGHVLPDGTPWKLSLVSEDEADWLLAGYKDPATLKAP